MIKISALKRSYDDFVAVDDVSFSIARGEIVGLLGHNGAGKTTIMKMISGYLEPDAGEIEIDGLSMASQRQQIQQQIGYLPEVLPVYPEMTVADYLDYSARLKGLSDEEAEREIRRVIQATDISAKILAPIMTLSRGYKQRVGVAQAILGKPKLLILDEPTNGLDPTQTLQMRALIEQIAEQATVIISTHIMQEVDALCDRVLIMRSGRMAIDSRLQDLRQSNQLLLKTSADEQALNQQLKSIQGLEKIAAAGNNEYLLLLKSSQLLDEITHQVAQNLIANEIPIYELRHEQRDLESVFREVNEQETQEVSHAA